MNIKGWPERREHKPLCNVPLKTGQCNCGAGPSNAMREECAKAVEGMQGTLNTKFKAKRIDNGEWVTGSLHTYVNDKHLYTGESINLAWILKSQNPDSSGWDIRDTYNAIPVIPESVEGVESSRPSSPCQHAFVWGHNPGDDHYRCEYCGEIPEATTERPSSPDNISPLPWRLGSLDRPWKEFVAECDRMSDDQQDFKAYSIGAKDDAIVCLLGPGPKSYENAKFIMDAVTKVEATTGGKVAVDKCELNEIVRKSVEESVEYCGDGARWLDDDDKQVITNYVVKGIKAKFTPGPVGSEECQFGKPANNCKGCPDCMGIVGKEWE